MIDRHVFRRREAIVRLDSRQVPRRAHSGARERVNDRLARMRQDVRVVFALGKFGGELLRGEEEHGASIGHLRAVPDLDAAGDGLIELTLLLRVAFAHDPATRLRERIAPGVGEVDRGDVREMLVLEPEALVVLVAQPAKQPREGIILALAFALVPSGGAEKVTARLAVDGFHLLETDHCGDVVAVRFYLGGRGQNCDRTRRARSLMAAGGQPCKNRIGFKEKCAELALLGIELSGEVADVSGLNLSRFELGGCERIVNRLTHDGDEMLAFLGPVAGEVALCSAEDIDRFHDSLSLSSRRAILGRRAQWTNVAIAIN